MAFVGRDVMRSLRNFPEGIDGGKKLGVEPILKAKDMADQNVEHLGVMAYAAYFQWVKPRPQASKQIVVHIDSTSARVQQPVSCLIVG